jgi:sulfur-oxidizing protein SoxX
MKYTRPTCTARRAVAALATAVALAGCATYTPPTAEETQQVLRSSFRARGIAGLDRLQQSELQAACSQVALSGKEIDPALRETLKAKALATVKYPSDGRFLGDWKAGERVAQSGVGMQFSDGPTTVNGGNCYACHQLSKQEIAYGNIGPSLLNWANERGRTEFNIRYTWAKIWNAHAYNPCSQMPRFGDAGILTEAQVRDVMALLFDAQSPVNAR